MTRGHVSDELAENLTRRNRLAEAQAVEIDRLIRRCGGALPCRTLPAFDFEVHDLAAVGAAARALAEGGCQNSG